MTDVMSRDLDVMKIARPAYAIEISELENDFKKRKLVGCVKTEEIGSNGISADNIPTREASTGLQKRPRDRPEAVPLPLTEATATSVESSQCAFIPPPSPPLDRKRINLKDTVSTEALREL